MLVECIATKVSDLPPGIAGAERSTDDIVYRVQVGRRYVVYTMSHVADGPIEALVDPKWAFSVPMALFQPVDGRISRHWKFGQEWIEWPPVGGQALLSLWGYPEFVENRAHRMRLFDAQVEDLKVFEKYKSLMDMEYPDPTVSLAAVILDEAWLQCAKCGDAWESRAQCGMIKCPSCGEVELNPRWVDSRGAG